MFNFKIIEFEKNKDKTFKILAFKCTNPANHTRIDKKQTRCTVESLCLKDATYKKNMTGNTVMYQII